MMFCPHCGVTMASPSLRLHSMSNARLKNDTSQRCFCMISLRDAMAIQSRLAQNMEKFLEAHFPGKNRVNALAALTKMESSDPMRMEWTERIRYQDRISAHVKKMKANPQEALEYRGINLLWEELSN